MIQQLSLKYPAVGTKLGLSYKDAPSALEKSEEIGSPVKTFGFPCKATQNIRQGPNLFQSNACQKDRKKEQFLFCSNIPFLSSFCALQQLSLKHPAVHAKLGLPDKDAPSGLEKSEEMDSPEKHLDSPAKQCLISVKDLTPKELVALSVKHLSKGQKERAISFLRLAALDKDPDYINALIVMVQTQLQKGLLAEAVEYLERAISKVHLV
ncbi:hypothetical protein Patl1_24086 [Pistacia atlantica]|uniref:Uncharacterized protein n=1 Tax=Pistacia atlantica TaxID=434234 RepID=A0ACC0ZWF2_9ROSI|nr:hypothetical protein Patl1_24086 [Pistacia atlantica]